jgi:hypothetical protein
VNKRFLSIFIAAVLIMCVLAPLAAQDEQDKQGKPKEPPPQYTLGDQTLSINAGLFVPLFFLTYQFAAASTHLTVGGAGSLNWMAYVNSWLRVGIEVGGMFAFSPNGNTLLSLPITAKASYILSSYPFEIPFSLGVGMNVVKYIDKSMIDLILKPGVSGLWAYNASWSFGLNATYWWSMQFSKTADQGRIGNFLELSLCALYHY